MDVSAIIKHVLAGVKCLQLHLWVLLASEENGAGSPRKFLFLHIIQTSAVQLHLLVNQIDSIFCTEFHKHHSNTVHCSN